MALEKKNISFPFLKGRNSNPGEKSQVFGELQEAENLVCENTGDLKSRTGFIQEGNQIADISDRQAGGTISKGSELIASGDNVIILNKEDSSSYVKGKDDMWLRKGDVKACNHLGEVIDSSPDGTSSKPSFVSSNGFDVHVWVEQPYGREPFSPPNVASDEYKLKPAAMYYMVKGTVGGATIVPKTKIEDAELELRTPGRWTVSGINGNTGKVGPLWSPSASAIADLHVSFGDICVLKNDPGASTGRPASEDGTQEAIPARFNPIYQTITSDSIPTGFWEWTKYAQLGNASLFVDYTKGPNSNYYQMKPQLFLAPSGDYAILVYANGENPPLAQYNDSGKWKIFWRFINLGTQTFRGEFSPRQELPGLTLGSTDEISLARKGPAWDADYCLDYSDSPTVTGAGAETHNLGIAIAYQPEVAGAPGDLMIRTYLATGGPLAFTTSMIKVRERNVTTEFNLGAIRTKGKQSKGLGILGGIKTWGSDFQYGNPVLSPIVIKGMNKLERDSDENRIVSNIANTLILFADVDSLVPGSANIEAIPLSTQGAPGLIVPGPAVTYPVYANSSFEDILDVNEIYLVDVASPTLEESPAFPTYKGPQVIIEVTNPTTGNDFSDLTPVLSACDSWILQKQVFEAPLVDPRILMRNVSILSDGFRSPYITYSSNPETLFVVSFSSVPTVGVIDDKRGRTCLINEKGRVLSSWEPYSYSSTSASEQTGSTSLAKFNNNTSLRGLRSRICYNSGIPYTEMKFGSNGFDPGVNQSSYKWMIPLLSTIDLNPDKPFKNTSREGVTYIASGLLWKYDGNDFSENEFLTSPYVSHDDVELFSQHGTYTDTTSDDELYKLLLHCDGAQGATVFPNSSSATNTYNAQGGALVSTGIKKFGTASAIFDAFTGYLEGTIGPLYYFAALDFCIDMWIRPSNLSAAYQTLFSINGATLTGRSLVISINDTELLFGYYDATFNIESTSTFTFSPAPSNNVWSHIAVVRNGPNVYTYLNGSQFGLEYPLDIYPTINPGNSNPTIGARDNDSGVMDQFFGGYIDEFRILIGEPGYTGDFPVPTEAYSPTRSVRNFTPTGGLEAGKYTYYFNYFWLDANFDLQFSDTVKLFTYGLVVPQNGTPSFTIEGLQLTNHRENTGLIQPNNNYPVNAVVQVWRSPKDLSDGESGIVGIVPMSDNKRSYTFIDDPVAIEGEFPGGVTTPESRISFTSRGYPQEEQGIARVSPPSPVGICFHRGHLVVSTTSRDIYSSLILLDGKTATFSYNSGGNAFLFSPGSDDPITHVASTGNTLYCFTPNNVFAYFGDGPSISNIGVYDGPEVSGPNMGILPAGFAAKIPDGIIYQGQGGFYLLQGKGRPVYFGTNISDHEMFPVAGVAVSDENQQILIAMGGDYLQKGGTIVVYNWVYNIWTTWDLRDAIIPQSISGIANSVDSSGANCLYLMSSDGRIWRQKEESYTDANSWKDTDSLGVHKEFELKLSTTWIQIPEFHGQFRVYQSNLIGRLTTNPAFAAQSCKITARLFADWRGGARSTHVLVMDPSATPDQLAYPLEMGIRPTVQKCKSFAMQVVISDIVAAPPVLQGVAFLIAQRGAKPAFETANSLEGEVT